MRTRRPRTFRTNLQPSRRQVQARRLRAARWDDEELDDYDDEVDVHEETGAPGRSRVPQPRGHAHDVVADTGPDHREVVSEDVRPKRSRRRAALLGAAAAIVLAALLVAAIVLVTRGGDSPAARTSAPLAFRPPVAVPTGGEYVRARVLASGDVVVDHWIRSNGALSGLTIAVPRAAGLPASGLSVRRLETVAGGHAVDLPATIRSTRTASFPSSTTVHVSYVLHGATQRSGLPGRALVRLTALELTYAPFSTTRTLDIQSPATLALACSVPPRTSVPCGTEDDGRWRVDLTGAPPDQQVLAQVNLAG